MNFPKVTVANTVGAITLAGIVGQSASYLAATAYYSRFGLSPEQLSITPLNAFGRLYYTGSIAATIIIFGILSFALASSRNNIRNSTISLPYSSSSTELIEWKVREPLRRRKLAKASWRFAEIDQKVHHFKLIVLLLLGVGTLALIFYGAHTLGDQAGRVSVNSDYESNNPVRADLIPRAVLYRWTKPEESATLLYTTENNTIPDYKPIRSGLLIGIGNGTTFIYDDDIKRTIAVPSSQVQLSIYASS
ncbi:hypothetical protein [Amycolatopsis sp. NPDC098790]|uniref:hypothetical protein n=1 Tax=Amycolatopsis sp. NPDC098790 TaxID=3363939 RepID=UPI00380FE965